MLAKAGLRTLVLEKAPLLGGCSRSDPNIFPGYKVNTGGIAIQRPIKRIARDLGLEQFGFEPVEVPENEPVLYYMVGEKYEKQIPVYRDVEATCEGIAKYSKQEADGYRRMMQDWAPFTRAIGQIFNLTQPSYTELFRVLESLGQKAMWLYLGKAFDVIKQYFSTDWMGGVFRIAWAAGFNFAQPGTAYATQYVPSIHWRPPFRSKGGMAGLVEPMAKLIEHQEGEVRKNSGVSKIIIEDGRAKGVRLESGEEIEGSIILSGTNAKITYLRLVGEDKLPPDFAEWVKRQNEAYSMCVLYLTLSEKFPIECPEFQMAKGLKHLTEVGAAWDEGRLGTPCLYIDNVCPSDPTMAPPGGNYIALEDIITCRLKGSWDEIREQRAEAMLNEVEKVYPDIRKKIIDRRLLTPIEYERDFNLWQGSVIGPGPTLDYMYSLRLPYRAPIKNLYITGMSAHPIGGIIGIPGINAARVITEDLEKGRVKK
jgi:phytoene dehydrogenase-like protein